MVGRFYEHGSVRNLSGRVKELFPSSRQHAGCGRVVMALCQPAVCLMATSGFTRAHPSHLFWARKETFLN